MIGDISNFKSKVGDTMKTVLNNYSPEIEIVLGPAKVILRAKNNKTLMTPGLQQLDVDERI